ncbi:MAG: ABC transporter substrate-binding protein [Betaproteobacteria bacterium HGW-Betaproteobacteria-16]|nr:MAG: ABC transporter substrate-binding protein [Betaproteobacteria bacterium HGW-Betaproteobacteria-16]
MNALKTNASLFLLLGLCATFSVQAASVRVANQGDVLSLDPHSLNEAVQLSFLNNVFESLVTRGKDLKLTPSLAVAWRLKSPTVWQFDLRKDVVFHDGASFSADDVVFSLDRARGEGSDVRSQLGTVKGVRKTGNLQIEIDTTVPNPILPDVITNILIINKAWAEANNATRPVDRRRGIENAASFRANGTGPFRVRERQPGVRTVLGAHSRWWGKSESNLDEIVFMPITNDSTRVAALLTGEVDVIDPVPLQDLTRVKAAPGLGIQQSPESRIVFLGFDQKRDGLLVSNVKGKNPFKDQRVRQAVYQAIDIETIASKVMRGLAKPTGSMVAQGIRGYSASMEPRLAYNPDAARKLLAEAGYPEGFEAGFNCPNDRYTNDAEICQAVAANLARIGVRLKIQAESKTTYFPRALKRDVTMFMLGWSPAGYDAHNLLYTVLATPEGAQGQWNFGAYSNAQVDALTQRIQIETDDKARNRLISEALALHAKDIGHVPLHQQMVTWGMKSHIKAYQRADGFMLFKWMTVEKR